MSSDKAHQERRPVVSLFPVNIKCGLNSFMAFMSLWCSQSSLVKNKTERQKKNIYVRVNIIFGSVQYIFWNADAPNPKHVTVLIFDHLFTNDNIVMHLFYI